MANKSILAAFERMWQHTLVALGNKSDMGHNHNDLYCTKSEIDTKLTDTTAATNSIIESALQSKMDRANPAGVGSFSLNRMPNSRIGDCSFAEGSETEASDFSSHAEGYHTISEDYAAHAEGEFTVASGRGCHAEGYSSVASGVGSHAEGGASNAPGEYSHAEGNRTNASGRASHAEGDYSNAFGQGSHAEGYRTQAGSSYQHVQGKCNLVDYNDTYAHIVGNGTSGTKRSNAHTLDWNGNAWFAGDVRIGGTKYDDASIVATKAYVDSKETALKEYVDSKETTTKAYVDSKEVTLKGYTDSKVETLKEYVDSKEVIVPQSDWNETDETSLAYILNKPKINKDSIILVDQINGYDYIIQMRNGILTSSLVVKDIKVTTLPNKTIYYEGEEFDPEGMVVTATYPDGSTSIIENCTGYFESNTTAIIVYTEAGVSYTDRITIQVNPFDPEVVLVDFVYTNNGDGTYTITDWKGTTNGTPSTEIIVPNNPKIIL